MIRALLLIVDGSRTWERIKTDQAGVIRISFLFVLPLLLLTGAAEGLGLFHWGAERGSLGRISKVPLDLILKYQLIQLLGDLIILYAGSVVLQKIGASFHRRHTYTECFTTLAYCLNPVWLARLADAFPTVPTWACYAVGIFLALSHLYRAIPLILRPDPSNALGLFMLCAFVLLGSTGLFHFLATAVLEEKLFAGL